MNDGVGSNNSHLVIKIHGVLLSEELVETIMEIFVISRRRSYFMDNVIYIGRPTALGNKYSHLNLKHTVRTATVEEAVQRYKEWLEEQYEAENRPVRAMLNQIYKTALNHKVYLQCWCKDELNPSDKDHACHAEVVRDFILQKHKEKENVA